MRAEARLGPLQTAVLLMAGVLFCAGVFIVSRALPFAWFFEVSALVITSLFINKVLKKGTFATIYVLYEDRLVILTRYGLIEKETGVFPLSASRFYDSFIEYEGNNFPFYPDETLKNLLNSKTAS
jgi:hypothetical protein